MQNTTHSTNDDEVNLMSFQRPQSFDNFRNGVEHDATSQLLA
jgi:hypothetical protein